MSILDIKKDILLRDLKDCLNSLGVYDINAIMPLLYVLVAYKHKVALKFTIASGVEKAKVKSSFDKVASSTGEVCCLLDEIRSLVPESYFEGKYVDILYDFLINTLRNDEDLPDDYYADVIEYVIDTCTSRGGKYAGITSTPTEVASLMAFLTNVQNPKMIFDPCAGLSSYAILPELREIPFTGYELDLFTSVLAKIRLDAFGKNGNIIRTNALSDWNLDKNCDTLVSEPPFGIKLNSKENGDLTSPFMEDYIIYKFINTPSIRKAVLLVSSVFFARKENHHLRESISNNNWIESVIKLPTGILPYTSIATGVLVLNKDKKSSDVKFILADDCIKSLIYKSKKLDTNAVIDRITGEDDKQCCLASLTELSEHDFSFDPVQYVSKRIEVLPGQKIVKFLSLVDILKGERKYADTKGRILQPMHMSSTITESQTRDILFEEQDLPSAKLVKICAKCIIFNVAADKFFIKDDEEPLFISPSYNCFEVKQNKCIPEYLAESVVNAERFRESALKGNGMQRVNYNDLLIPIYEDIVSQKQIIQRIYRQEQNELKKKLETLQVLSGRSSDLIHNLGVTFTKIGASIGILRNNIEESETVDKMYDNVQFALRLINSTGADFGKVKPEFEKANVFDALSQYVKAWKNFGYQSFDILPIKMEMSKDTKVEIDTSLFYTVLDCIFINAHQHGFNKRNLPDNRVMMMVEGVEYQEKRYIRIGISNNGNPLPADFSLTDFVSRGVVGINSSQDGLGGDHIHKIVNKFGGLVSIESEPEWLTFNVLLPVYLTSNDTKFTEYDCECI